MRILFWSAVIASMFFSACQKETSKERNNKVLSEPQPLSAKLQGNIYDEHGVPAAGVMITVANQTTTTNPSGYFKLDHVTLDQNASVVTAEKAGYFKAFRTFCATSATNQVVIRLTKKMAAGRIDANSGGTVALSNGSKISFKTNSVVIASSGIPYSGDIHVFAAYIDPTSENIGENFPGSVLADDNKGKRVVLSSYGMLAVELESTSGEKLQIAPGQSAMISSTIPSSLLSTAPVTIPLWYINEQTGIWKEEGLAVKSGSSYVGEVKHFSWWNCDVPNSAVMFTTKIRSADGLPLTNACVRARSLGNFNVNGYTWTDSLGQVRSPMPINQDVYLEILDPCKQVIYSKIIGPFTQNTDMADINVSRSASIVTIKGNVAGCSGEKLTKSYVVITVNNIVYTSTVDGNGNFMTSFTRCAGTATNAEIFGVNPLLLQQGSPLTLNITAPVTDVGTITACGNPLQQFIDYTLDGVQYIILDSLDAYINQVPATGESISLIFGKGMASSERLNFSINNATGPGSYPLNGLGIRNYYSISTNPAVVNLTTFPQIPGQYFEGTFSAGFTQSAGPLHTVNGSFRLRRRY